MLMYLINDNKNRPGVLENRAPAHMKIASFYLCLLSPVICNGANIIRVSIRLPVSATTVPNFNNNYWSTSF